MICPSAAVTARIRLAGGAYLENIPNHGDVGQKEKNGRVPHAPTLAKFAVNMQEGTMSRRKLRKPDDHQYRLCYVDEGWMYFTDNWARQWGDDWNDGYWDCNAGTPYEYISGYDDEKNRETGHGHIKVICFHEDEKIVNDARNSYYSVDDINAGRHPWLFCEDAGPLNGGATYEDALKWLKKADCYVGEMKKLD